jgi:DNA-binding MarR family transcriptional regulator
MIESSKDLDIITKLQRLAFRIERHADQILLEKLGIGFSQFKIIHELERNPKAKQNQIAKALGQTEASISRQVKIMREDRLLITSINPNNKREHITTLTPKGARIKEAATESLDKLYKSIIQEIALKDIERVDKIIDTIALKA